jgi:hypothetical protein
MDPPCQYKIPLGPGRFGDIIAASQNPLGGEKVFP